MLEETNKGSHYAGYSDLGHRFSIPLTTPIYLKADRNRVNGIYGRKYSVRHNWHSGDSGFLNFLPCSYMDTKKLLYFNIYFKNSSLEIYSFTDIMKGFSSCCCFRKYS